MAGGMSDSRMYVTFLKQLFANKKREREIAARPARLTADHADSADLYWLLWRICAICVIAVNVAEVPDFHSRRLTAHKETY